MSTSQPAKKHHFDLDIFCLRAQDKNCLIFCKYQEKNIEFDHIDDQKRPDFQMECIFTLHVGGAIRDVVSWKSNATYLPPIPPPTGNDACLVFMVYEAHHDPLKGAGGFSWGKPCIWRVGPLRFP